MRRIVEAEGPTARRAGLAPDAAGLMEILHEAFQGRMGQDVWLEALIDRIEARP